MTNHSRAARLDLRLKDAHRTKAAFALGVALALAACSDAPSPGGATAYPRDGLLRLNQVQVVGSHNSYHVQAAPALFSAIEAFDASLARTLEYSHAPIAEQLEAQGVRQLELDVFADPTGGRYASPAGPRAIDLPVEPSPALERPGFKVLHVQDIDFATTCETFVGCLETVRDWSRAHPGHVPLMVLVEAKDEPIPDPLDLGFVVPLPIGESELDALDDEIRSVFEPAHLVTPDDVRGAHATLEQAVRSDGWPTLGETRGRVLFCLDNEGEKRDAYVRAHPSLRDRVMFVSSPPGTPEAAFVKLNDPLTDGERIRRLVAEGFIVRTRADADTEQARSGDTRQREAALASGAQFVSTDYPIPDARFATGYRVSIPEGLPAGCNPVSAPPDCEPRDAESPDALTGG